MFLGEHRHSLDPKGRVIFPSKYRESLGDVFYLNVGTDKCISVYPEAEWQNLMDRIDAFPTSETAKIKRYLFSKSVDVKMDKQGRVLLPEELRERVGITAETGIMIAGAGKKIEIWNEQTYDEEMSKDDMQAENIAALMKSLGI